MRWNPGAGREFGKHQRCPATRPLSCDRDRMTMWNPSGTSAAAKTTTAPLPVAAAGLAIVGVLLFYGLQLNPSEAQAKDLPGSGDAIAGRSALAAAGISAGAMKML